ncbi:MAG: inositol monophosphatase family protein [Zoogloeaceae bacterium]|jgi:myo-inositol-1(or 4)-monophosphatase|nr:inositol monophosphatase family protein [Zoogloeaceae bacterium]
MSLDFSQLAELRPTVERIVREISEREVLPRFLKVSGRTKADGSAFSEADIAAQEALMRELSRLADLPMIGEEMTGEEQKEAWERGFSEGAWVMDPIDGSTNFLVGLPQFAVSVALLREGKPVLGVSCLPMMKEVYSSYKGGGLWVDGARLPAHEPVGKPLADAVASIDFKRLPPHLALRIVHEAPIYSQRNLGSSVLDWCYLAAGRLDAITHGGEHLWDYAAGQLMLEEMGGQVATFEDDDFSAASPWRRSIIAALDPVFFRTWRDWLREQMQVSIPASGG